MPNNRRKFTPKVAKPIPCEECLELNQIPTFLEALITVRKLTSNTDGTNWYHQNGHAVFVE